MTGSAGPEQYVPVPIGPDPARDARRAAYRAHERAQAIAALDRFLDEAYGPAPLQQKAHYGVPAADAPTVDADFDIYSIATGACTCGPNWCAGEGHFSVRCPYRVER